MSITTIKPVIAKVEVTNDYSKFRYMKANREVSRQHVQKLMTSFEENPNLVSTRPILVNERMEVIDGQHRLQALEALGWPVQYIISPGLDITVAQLMNYLQKPWTVMEYAKSYATSGNKHYQDFLGYHERYPIAVSALMAYLQDARRRRANGDFKSGGFKVSDDRATVDRNLDMLNDFSMYLPHHWTTHSFCFAFFNVCHSDHYDHRRMLEQLKLTKLEPQASRIEYLRALERIYNYNRKPTAQVRFF